MRKKLFALGMMMAVSSAFIGGCGEKNQGTENSKEVTSEKEEKKEEPKKEEETKKEENESTSEVEESTLLKDLVDANKFDDIVEKNGRVSYTLYSINGDGSETNWSYYQDKTRFVYSDIYGPVIFEGEDITYAKDEESGESFIYLFIGDEYEKFKSGFYVETIYGYSDDEEITSEEEKDGMLYLETKMSKESTEELVASYGYTSDDYDYVICEYVIESESKLIHSLKSYIVLGEKKSLFGSTQYNKDCEEYILDKTITDKIFGEDSRTLTVVADAGTTDEKTYTQTVTKGSYIYCFIPEEFEKKLYADSECTQVLEIDKTKDQTGYLKRIKE